MSDKTVAAFLAFLFVFPLTVVCCLGPAALVTGVVAALGWLSQSKPLLVLALALGGIFVLAPLARMIRRRSLLRRKSTQ